MKDDGNAAVSKFAELAKNFCSWCETDSELSTKWSSEAEVWLARLHCEALTFPIVSPENSDGVPPIPELAELKARRNLRAFAGHYYREFFNPDPKEIEEPVVGDVEDDLLDVYKDIKGGLVAYQRGEAIDALWHWSFLHRNHWGRHATGALYALHRSKSAE